MEKEISVVMISYNKYPQNYFTLYSMSIQSFDLTKVEVVLVDDASTDESKKLKDIEWPFELKYIELQENVGRSKAKNIGLENASGKIIIFLDVEMLVEPEFLRKHYELHQDQNNLVVSTTNAQKGLYAVLEADFNDEQIKHFCEIVKASPYWKKRLNFSNHDMTNIKKVVNLLKNRENPFILLTQDDFENENFESLCFDAPTFKPIIDEFGPNLNNFELPWIFSITRNISVPKYLLDKVGPFSEEFEGWGSEDNELGYRLFKEGAVYYDAPDITTYHQEHSYSSVMRKKDMIRNVMKFQELHPDMDLAVITLPFIHKGSFIVSSNLLKEVKYLNSKYPEDFQILIDTLYSGLRKAPEIFLETNQNINSLLKQLDINKDIDKRKQLLVEYNRLKELKEYSNIIHIFENLFL